ncbi:MAG: aldo/keto reductase [Methanocorpusculum sp.]|nr:aldo/keto reductase [Methanocorpusculum sp.]MDE2522138.1 aldo/keto reductase [Methanocorpusculum sp.]MDE2524333.1 aldo/keto reductase [Methanocorpusculum sp.]
MMDNPFAKKLGFGLMRLPLNNPDDMTDIDLKTMQNMVDVFMERGFSYFDTAYVYEGSEAAIRETLVRRYPRDSFTLTSKLPIFAISTEEEQEKIFREQLERAGVDYFDIYLLHNVNVENYRTAQKFHTFDFLKQLKTEGKIKTLGISYHDNAELLEEVLSAHPEIEIILLQINYLDWDNPDIQSGKCYEVARNHQIPVIVMEPLKGGTLADVPNEAGKLFRQYNPDASPASWAIRYAAGLDGVVMVLSGMSTIAQMLDNTAYMKDFVPLNEEEHRIVKEAAAIITANIAVPCTTCGYCLDTCPENIPIPKYFSLYNNKMQTIDLFYYPQQQYYENYTKTSGKASDCIECGACEEHCPQHLKITDLLKDVAKAFEVAPPHERTE